jgi:hypothetical protein
MHISNSTGEFINLSIVRYQFPGHIKSFWDDWLIIRLNARSSVGDWTVDQPCLTVHEAEGLVYWLVRLALSFPHSSSIFFTEPNLKFQEITIDSAKYLRVVLSHEFRTPWESGFDNPDHESYIDVPFSQIDFQILINNFIKELRLFPPRIIRASIGLIIRDFSDIDVIGAEKKIKSELAKHYHIHDDSVKFQWDPNIKDLLINFPVEYSADQSSDDLLRSIRKSIHSSVGANEEISIWINWK